MRRPAMSLLLVALVLVGCGGSAAAPDAGLPDGGAPDAGRDAGTGADAGDADGGAPDGGDGGVPTDGGADGGLVEVRIDEVAPARGPAAGGTRVRLRGRGFVEGFAEVGDDDVDARTAVLFGANTALDVTVVDDDTLEAVAPPGLTGARDVVVQNPNGEARCAACFTFFVPVTLGAVSPVAVPVEGGSTLTFTGTGFTEDTQVRVGERLAIGPTVVDGTTLTAIAPPGAAAGRVDVTVFNPNGQATLRRGLAYEADPALTRVVPPVADAAGGAVVRLEGAGLADATGVSFGGRAAPSFAAAFDGTLEAEVPSGVAGTVVDVTVRHPRGDAVLADAFAWTEAGARALDLLVVSPARAPLAGGVRVVVGGTGLDQGTPQVRFGDTDASSVTVLGPHAVEAVVPPAAVAGSVDVQVRNAAGGDVLAAGFAYEAGPTVEAVVPASGPIEGGTPVTVTGTGFTPGATLRVGALLATDVEVVDGETLTAVTPPGSPGLDDVVVTLGAGPDAPRGRAPDAYTYTAPLALAQVDPPSGARSGGTRVTLLGVGFGPDTEVRFGDGTAVVERRTGTSTLVVRTPPGAPGPVAVTVWNGEAEDTLPAAFHYYDPTNPRGGASGGPMAGTLNVTVLDAYSGAPLPGGAVRVGPVADGLTGTTDAWGQVTFSDPVLVKPATVTAGAPGHETVTVAALDARDLTLFLAPNEVGSGTPTSFPPASYVGGGGGAGGGGGDDGSMGRVCGFKLPPDRTLGPGETAEARVSVAARGITSLPPFGRVPPHQTVAEDCGSFGLPARSGSVALYAVYGIAGTETDAEGRLVDTFEPLLMGVRRGVEVPPVDPPVCSPNQACPGGFTCAKAQFDPANPADFAYCLCDDDDACDAGEVCNPSRGCQRPVEADIVLSMHLDQSVPVRLVDPPVSAEGEVRHATYSYLDLGGEGAIYVGEHEGVETAFELDHHPDLPADGFVFLDMATSGGGYPLSLYYRRAMGELSTGIDIGPMQPFTAIVSPPPGGTLAGDRLEWTYGGEPIPDLVMVSVDEPGFVPLPLWSVILPGTETGVEVPPEVLERLRAANALSLTVRTALAPRFDFDHFSYGQLGLRSWNSFTLDVTSFAVY